LKNNKASSFDQILNEMLKFGHTYIIDPLCGLVFRHKTNIIDVTLIFDTYLKCLWFGVSP
jgi:hypothetical protein